MSAFHKCLLLFLVLLMAVPSVSGKVQPAKYEVALVTDGNDVNKNTLKALDTLLSQNRQLAAKQTIYVINKPRVYENRTTDFYLLLILCFMLGAIRYSDTRYFYNLWKAFINTTLSNRQLKDQLQSAGWPNFLMNVFFAISAGAYIYYVIRAFGPVHSSAIPPSLLILMLIAGMMVIYASKYAAIRFSGWAFRVEGITDHYLFNVFLINKIISIILIPFIIILAFAGPQWAEPVIVCSVIAVAGLFVNRYVRSWQVFGSFFLYSKFHFFTYLCASELLPLALLMKLLVKGILFY